MAEGDIAGRPTVLFITRKWPPAVGGMETYCVELVRALEPLADLRLHALPGRPDGTPPRPSSLMVYGLKLAWKLLTTKERFAVVHGADMAVWPLVWLASIRSLTPRLLLSAHGTDVAFGTRRGGAARIYGAYLKIGAKLLPNCLVVANSTATGELAKQFGYAHVKVVPLAATASVLPQSKCEHTGQPYVAFVGRLIPRKGCAWFIREVLPRLPQDVRLKVAGTVLDPSEREALGSSRVEYLGSVFGDELAALRRDAIAVVVPNQFLGPTSFEGFGLTAVEAAMDGGVAVAARLDGLNDAVIDEVTGFLEPPGNAARWVARLESIRAWSPSRRAAFVEGARRAASSYYSWERVARQTAELYGSHLTSGR